MNSLIPLLFILKSATLFAQDGTRFTLRDCANDPNENHIICYHDKSLASLQTTLTTLDKVKLSMKGRGAKALYLNILYVTEIEPNLFVNDNLAISNNLECRKSGSEYTCNMYYDLKTQKFENSENKPFSILNVGEETIESTNGDALVFLGGMTEYNGGLKEHFYVDKQGDDFYISFNQNSALFMFEKLSIQNAPTPTIDNVLNPIINPLRLTVHSDSLVCHKKLRASLNQCRMIFDIKKGLFDLLPVGHSILKGLPPKNPVNITGVWLGNSNESVPTEAIAE